VSIYSKEREANKWNTGPLGDNSSMPHLKHCRVKQIAEPAKEREVEAAEAQAPVITFVDVLCMENASIGTI
jgi:hypothetical protein